MQPAVYEMGDTIQFSWTASLAPDAAPNLAIQDEGGTYLYSGTAQQSSSVQYYAMVTMPYTPGWFLYQWTAYKTIASSAYPFINRGVFRVDRTTLAQFTTP